MNKIVIFAFGLISFKSFAQGCSDAGFCSLGDTHITQKENSKNGLEFGLGFASGEEEIAIFSQFVTYSRNVNSNLSLSLKVTGQSASKDGISNFNIGDAYLSGNYKFKSDVEYKKWSVLFGAKIPFTDANDTYNGFSLPMVYQSSLGTFDAIAGLNYSYKKWDFNTAVQIPLTDNKNQFTGSTEFSPTNGFKRQPDALLRGSYTLKSSSKKFTYKPNLLLIYHFGKDSYLNDINQRVSIDGSAGLTANANIIINYKLNDSSSLETSVAFPFLVREERPDGLTRSFTIGLSYKLGF
jgi:hypothetical protein